jgi:3-oxoacyl-[acyl-carrier-protein] synthase III
MEDKTMGVKISGLGAAVPCNRVTNHELSKKLNTSDEWITTRTGIKSRYHYKSVGSTSELAYEAGQAAIMSMQKNVCSVESFDTLILATSTPDRLCPATAPKVAYKLGFGKVSAFDINAVCSGFIYGLELAEALLKSGKSKKLMLIGADVFSSILDPTDRATLPLFGDAAGAIVLENAPSQDNLISTLTRSDGKYQDLITIKNGGCESKLSNNHIIDQSDNFFKMEGKEVFSKAISNMKDVVRDILMKNKLDVKDIDLLIPHQANLRIINTLSDLLDMERDKVLISLDEYGNTSAASIPLTLVNGCIAGRIKPNDKIVVTAFGGGLTWGAGLVKWPIDEIKSKIIFVK